MPQGNNKKLLTKRARKGHKGYPVATIAFYGPTNKVATKLVCGIIKTEGSDPDILKKWTSNTEVRKSELILGEVLAFIQENAVGSVAMVEEIIGCPHEEGIDYPEGKPCPQCKFWHGRDRFSHEMLH